MCLTKVTIVFKQETRPFNMFVISCPWVQMAPEDIRWEGGDPGIIQQGRGATVHGGKKSSSRNGPMSGPGRGSRGPQKNTSRKEFPPSQNGVGKKSSDCIEILHTESLIKEVSLEETLPVCLDHASVICSMMIIYLSRWSGFSAQATLILLKWRKQRKCSR